MNFRHLQCSHSEGPGGKYDPRWIGAVYTVLSRYHGRWRSFHGEHGRWRSLHGERRCNANNEHGLRYFVVVPCKYVTVPWNYTVLSGSY